MTKEEILNGMSEEEFYSLYPTKESWENAQAQMAYGGSPYNPGNPFGAGIMLANGGTPYYGGPIYPAQRGAAVPVPAPDPDAFMAKLDNPPMKPVQFPTFNTRSQYDKFKAGNVNFAKYSDADMQGLGVDVPAQIDRVAIKKQEEWNKAHPWTRSAGTTPEGAQLFHKTGQSGTPQDYFYNTKSGSYDPYNPIPVVAKQRYGGLPGGPHEMPCLNCGGSYKMGGLTKYQSRGEVKDFVPMSESDSLAVTKLMNTPGFKAMYNPEVYDLNLERGREYDVLSKVHKKTGKSSEIGGWETDRAKRAALNELLIKQQMNIGKPVTGTPYFTDTYQKVQAYKPTKKQQGGSMTPDLEGTYPSFGYGGYDSVFNYGQFPAMQYGGSEAAWNPYVLSPEYRDKVYKEYTQSYPYSEYQHYKNEAEYAEPNRMDSLMRDEQQWNERAFMRGSKEVTLKDLEEYENYFKKRDKELEKAKAKLKEKEKNIPEWTRNYRPKPSIMYPTQGMLKKHGGLHKNDVTSQGGNQSFLDERNNNYLNYIKNNVLNNMHEEESQKVQDAFMQMDNQYMQMGGNSFDRVNPQNAALQNMYGQQMQQYQNQAAQDQSNFREANINLLGSIYGMHKAQKGEETSSASALIKQLAEQFGPTSRKTGLPLFPANINTYYQMNKKGAEALAGIPEGFKMEGFEMTPQWGLGARTAMNVGNLFRKKDNKKVMPGWAPKAITFKFSGKRGYMPGEPRPDGKTTPQQQQAMAGPMTAEQAANPYGQIPAGTTQAPAPYLPASIKPGYDASGRLLNPPQSLPGTNRFNMNTSLQPYSGLPLKGRNPDLMNSTGADARRQLDIMRGPYTGEAPGVFYNQADQSPYGFMDDVMSNQSSTMASEQFRAYGGDYFGQYYNGGMPMYQGSILGSQTGNPIQLTGAAPATSFNVPKLSTPSAQSAGIKTPPVIQQADESKNTTYEQGPQVQYDATKDRSNEDVNVEATLKRKRSGIGQAIGQYAVPAMNKVSSILEQKDYRKAKQKLEESMLADNTFMTSPMNNKSRGDYDPNSGMFRPDQMVPVQFPGYAQWGGFNTFAMGGSYDEGEELDLTPEEIEDLRQQGYEIEYLD